MKKRIIQLSLCIVFLIADQATKYWAAVALKNQNPIEIIKGFFYLTYAENSGAAWSIFQGQSWLFISIGCVAIVALLIWYFKTTRPFSQFALVLMLAGAAGNLLDRFLIAGRVRDFLDFYIFGYDFPIFNVADSCLTIGVALMFIDLLVEEYHGKRNTSR